MIVNKNRAPSKMKLLNLYSGTGSVSKPWKEKGYEVYNVDVDPRFSPDYCGDILQWDYKKLHFVPDVIWASPPCDQYSRARTTGGPRNLRLADKLVAKAVIGEMLGIEKDKNKGWEYKHLQDITKQRV